MVVAKTLGLDAEQGAHPQSSARRRLRPPARVRLHRCRRRSSPSSRRTRSRSSGAARRTSSTTCTGPTTTTSISAGLDENGKLVAWNHRIVGSSIMARFFPPAFKDGVDPDAVDGAIELPYDIPNFHVDYVREEPPGIPTAFWRGVGPTRNAYVVESFIDELAAAAEEGPVRVPPRAHRQQPARPARAGARRGHVGLGHAARAAQGPRHRAAVRVRQLHRRRSPR